MKTIRAFVDGLFNEYEDSEEINRAKDELYAMMEDKYLDLRDQGKSENEAMGEVIASIGTLEELEEEFDLRLKDEKRKDFIHLTRAQVEEYLRERKEFGKWIGRGVVLCILAIVPLFLLYALNPGNDDMSTAIGVAFLLGIIALAVGIFVKNGMAMGKYEEFEIKDMDLEEETRSLVENEARKFQPVFQKRMTLGIVSFILAAIPIILVSILFNEESYIFLTLVLLLAFVAFGVNQIVSASIMNESYNILLEKGEYENKEAIRYMEGVAGIYWSAVVVIYLAWSFLSGDWHFTWIVWPIAGTLYAFLSTIAERKIS